MNKAILLLGPTGSGKSPLGDELEANGLNGRRCLHFDFGRRLRRAAEGRPATLDAGGIRPGETRPSSPCVWSIPDDQAKGKPGMRSSPLPRPPGHKLAFDGEGTRVSRGRAADHDGIAPSLPGDA